MLLSNAIATGRVLPFEVNPNSFCGCAIGMGVAAITGSQCESKLAYGSAGVRGDYTAMDIAIRTWPWLKDSCPEIPSIAEGARAVTFPGVTPYTVKPGQNFLKVISAIFYNVEAGKVTLDQLIDFVRLVEPPEVVEAVVEEIPAQCETVLV